MEKLAELPPPALFVFGATLAIIFAVRYFGLVSGTNASPANSQGAAQVAAVIVDPTALNNATKALEAHTEALVEFIDVAKDINRSLTHIGTELDRIREEMRIQRELSRRPVS
ncbi:hypothetical protein G6L37_13690 [Agrobacterium rubi]|uniref:hypothetical protein n=1 Tax=Agrobacterium rubi TaxID=28099 RepID=UPI001573E348|nr:hypothetical protein [Agrobacterium rubi]NTF07199.1 hypothetical protein [Agrobacterium rubi]NTF19455.1 hypothetical protein [Agrobacterium rubi]NTF26418.1 hypothetical protein [Agrobacterium rubi]